MKSNGTLSGVLHVLLHMAESPHPITSEVLARAMNTNPVVVRRTMAGLREAGLVRSEKGHGGGWSIARPLEAITLRDIYRAIGAPGLFALGHRSANPHCLVEKAVNHALDGAFDAAQTLLLQRFASVTLASLSADFHAGMVATGHSIDLEHAHER